MRPLAADCALVGLCVLALGCSAAGPAATVSSAVEWGTLSSSPLIVGRDGAATAQLWGQEVWLFGDTFLSVSNAEGQNFISNTFSISAASVDAGLTLADRLDDAGAPEALIVPTAAEAAFDLSHQSLLDSGCEQSPCGGRFATWPSAGVFDPDDGGTALVFYQLISAAPGADDFQGIGQGLAIWSDFDGLPLRPVLNLCDGGSPTALFCADEPAYGEGAALVGGGIYNFACPQSGFDYPCQLARVSIAQALDKTAWQYWDGAAWSADLSRSKSLFDGAPILSFFIDTHIGQ